MLAHTDSKASPVRPATRFIPVAAIAASLVVVGCSNASAEADISESGQLAYACALAEHLEAEHQGPAAWDVYVGNQADPGARETAAIGALTTGSDDADLADTGTNLLEGMARLDIEVLKAGLEEIRDTCDSLDITQKVDVSHEAQLDYACALANGIADTHGSATAWLEQPDSDAWHELTGATALTGAFNGQILAEHQELSEAGIDLLRALQVHDADGIGANLETFQSECMEL